SGAVDRPAAADPGERPSSGPIPAARRPAEPAPRPVAPPRPSLPSFRLPEPKAATSGTSFRPPTFKPPGSDEDLPARGAFRPPASVTEVDEEEPEEIDELEPVEEFEEEPVVAAPRPPPPRVPPPPRPPSLSPDKKK